MMLVIMSLKNTLLNFEEVIINKNELNRGDINDKTRETPP